MAQLENNIIERAKKVDMIALLQSEEGFSFKSTSGGKELRCIEHNSLVINGDRHRWYWNSRQVGGNNAIDYLMKTRQMNFCEAVIYLAGKPDYTFSAYNPQAPSVNIPSNEKTHRFILPEQAHFADGRRNYSNIIAYLNKVRKININIINTLIAKGQIYQGVQYNGLHIVGYNTDGMAFYRFNNDCALPCYTLQTLSASPENNTDTYETAAISSKYIDNVLMRDNGNKIFKNNLVIATGKNKDGEIAYAAFRSANTRYKFRGEVSGSDKGAGFLIEGSIHKDSVYVFESFIDAMSHADLYNIKYKDPDAWKMHNRLALGGTAGTALFELLKQKPKIRKICLCLDNDKAGRCAAHEIGQKLRDMGYTEVFERYPREKDYNEELGRVKEGLGVEEEGAFEIPCR